MKSTPAVRRLVLMATCVAAPLTTASVTGQLPDRTQAPNAAEAGIALSLADQIGAGRGDWNTIDSSDYIITRDPFRAIRRGRQLFQRKFTHLQGQGPVANDGVGDIGSTKAIGAGLSDSCAGCHGRPRGAAGFGGDVATRPDSRDAPHLFGLGLKEMLADEMTAELRTIRTMARAKAMSRGVAVLRPLVAKGVAFGLIVANPDGSVDTSQVEGVDADLRIRPFFAEGGTMSIREFVVGALNAEMGLQAPDIELAAAHNGARIVTRSGMVLDATLDRVEAPPTGPAEVDTAIVDYLEFYLFSYFKPGLGRQTEDTSAGRRAFERAGCQQCHRAQLTIARDRRVADVETVFDPVRGIFNNLYATASARFVAVDDGTGHPAVKRPLLQPFVVHDIYADFKRHDLGPGFHERNYDGTLQREFLTTPLWGVGSTGPYGHDGRSVTLHDVILRHGGEAQDARDAYAAMGEARQQRLQQFLQSLILFPPDDTASNLDPGDPTTPGFPQFGHGSIKLTALFNDPRRVE
jgi:mono/diheme cytochrome c family protein